MLVYSRTQKSYPRDCPYCNGHLNCECQSIAILFPELLPEIDWDLMEHDPKTISAKSDKPLPWKCLKKTCGHHKLWASPWNRTQVHHPTGCPYCSGRLTCICDSVHTLYHELVLEIDDTKPHDDLKSTCPGSNKVFPWKCRNQECGHTWECMMWIRTNGAGCPMCSATHMENICGRHLIQLKVTFEPQKQFPDCKWTKPLLFDYYLPTHQAIIELDGIQHFEEVNFDEPRRHLISNYKERKIKSRIPIAEIKVYIS